MIRRRLVVTGRVQNVFYRAWFVDQARALGPGSVLDQRRVVTEPILVSGKKEGGSDAEAS